MIRRWRRHTSARRAVQESQLDEEWLVDILDRICRFADGSRQRIQSDRPAGKLLDHRHQQATIRMVQPAAVDFKHLERLVRHFVRDDAIARNLRHIAYALEQAIRYARRAARSLGNLECPLRLQWDLSESLPHA